MIFPIIQSCRKRDMIFLAHETTLLTIYNLQFTLRSSKNTIKYNMNSNSAKEKKTKAKTRSHSHCHGPNKTCANL